MAPPQVDDNDSYKEKEHRQQQQQQHLTFNNRPDEKKIASNGTGIRIDEEKKAITEMVGVSSPGGREQGWHQLRDDDNNAIDASTTTTGNNNNERKKQRFDGEMGGNNENDDNPSIEIELQETGGTTGSGRRIFQSFARFGGKGSQGVAAGAQEEEWSGQYRVYRRRWFGLLQLTLMNIIVSWDWLTFSPVSKNAALYFGTDENTINWLSTAFMFAFVFITPVVIYVLHLGPKPSIITSAALLLAGNWIRYGGSHSRDGGRFGVVMFGQILTGLAQPFVLAAPARFSDIWFTDRGRVGATALTTLANPFGAALGQLIVPFWVNEPGDVSRMVLYVSIISSVCSIPSFFIPAAPPTPVAPSSETPKLSLLESGRILFGHLEFWLIFIAFAVYVGCFNSISSILAQIMQPYGYTYDEAGIAGAVLIVVGLVASAIFSPLVGRTRAYLTAIRVTVPLIGLCYLIFIWMPPTHDSGGLAGPYLVLAVLGAASFSLMPVVLEFLVELTHPISPAVTSTVALSGGQLLGGIFIIISGALKAGDDGDPPLNMQKALVFTAVIAMAAVVPPLCLGLFGRGDKVSLRRVNSDDRATATDTGV